MQSTTSFLINIPPQSAFVATSTKFSMYFRFIFPFVNNRFYTSWQHAWLKIFKHVYRLYGGCGGDAVAHQISYFIPICQIYQLGRWYCSKYRVDDCWCPQDMLWSSWMKQRGKKTDNFSLPSPSHPIFASWTNVASSKINTEFILFILLDVSNLACL